MFELFMAAFLQAWDKDMRLLCPVQLLLMGGNHRTGYMAIRSCIHILIYNNFFLVMYTLNKNYVK